MGSHTRSARTGSGPLRLGLGVAVVLVISVALVTTLTFAVAGNTPVAAEAQSRSIHGGQRVVGQTPDSPSSESADSDSPGRVRDETEKILQGKEFSYEKGYLERFLEWLGRRLNPNFDLPAGGAGSGALGGLLGTFIAWFVLLAAAAGLTFVIFRYVRARRPRVKPDEQPLLTVVEQGRSVDEWATEAELFEERGEWKQAIRARYRMIVRELTDRGQLPDIAGTTTGELREALGRSTPEAATDFDAASTLFELPWYGAKETGPAESLEMRRLTEELLEVQR